MQGKPRLHSTGKSQRPVTGFRRTYDPFENRMGYSALRCSSARESSVLMTCAPLVRAALNRVKSLRRASKVLGSARVGTRYPFLKAGGLERLRELDIQRTYLFRDDVGIQSAAPLDHHFLEVRNACYRLEGIETALSTTSYRGREGEPQVHGVVFGRQGSTLLSSARSTNPSRPSGAFRRHGSARATVHGRRVPCSYKSNCVGSMETLKYDQR